ncbi:hypothetical protein K402DRAFT_77310 [Aulographum hederae CBS 113979]|uniref:Uncharacterized protein n=1 Tax=Aulographum hederae CBS 113979 TaxID=1176131 RepID=A0A6G1HG02_9PEZI|nr:hypothetical protein K402DRAFT_77310 [Aulographum hederae CBS 113979]
MKKARKRKDSSKPDHHHHGEFANAHQLQHRNVTLLIRGHCERANRCQGQGPDRQNHTKTDGKGGELQKT